MMHIRKYNRGEEDALWELHYNAVHRVAARDYTDEQLQAWAPREIDTAAWRAKMAAIDPYVCVYEDGDSGAVIVGYADLQPSGLIDHFFVHHRWQGRGAGKRLMAAIEADAQARGIARLTAHVSITARPFFQRRGFRVIAPQEVTRGGVALKNFQMAKELRES